MSIEERWKKAQVRERELNCYSLEEGLTLYGDIYYKKYFEYLEMELNQDAKTILEIGCADFPALHFCYNYKQGYIIEPMPSEKLKNFIKDKPILLMEDCAENLLLPSVQEIWLFNVLQHVKDPDKIITKCKGATKTIRFFEPINYPPDEAHLHEFTLEYFKEQFGDCVKYYGGWKEEIKGFHNSECAYGTWIRE